jgi:hypothetical protein
LVIVDAAKLKAARIKRGLCVYEAAFILKHLYKVEITSRSLKEAEQQRRATYNLKRLIPMCDLYKIKLDHILIITKPNKSKIQGELSTKESMTDSVDIEHLFDHIIDKNIKDLLRNKKRKRFGHWTSVPDRLKLIKKVFGYYF